MLLAPMLHPVGDAMLRAEVEVVQGWELSPDARAKELGRVQGLVGGGTEEHIALGTNLEVIASPGSGYEWVAVDAATAAGIAVVNAAGSQYSAVAEHGVGLMLALAKRIAYSDRVMHLERRFIDRPAFSRTEWPGWPTQLQGKTIGLVGFGFVGRDLAEKCRLAFGMRVLAFDPYFDPVEAVRQHVEPFATLDELLPVCDYVSLHLPLTVETHGMIGARELGLMKPGSVLVNLSRGPTVDTEALVEALRRGQLSGATLDVFDPEPLPDGHPLYDFDNVVLTPHIGGWVAEAMEALSTTTAGETLRVLQGKRPFRLVNPEVWSRRRGADPSRASPEKRQPPDSQ
jgi:phosphoglycerate dehydrogenase-like enzyme